MAMNAYEYGKHFSVYPYIEGWNQDNIQPGWKKVADGFGYNSGTNTEWLDTGRLQELLAAMGFAY